MKRLKIRPWLYLYRIPLLAAHLFLSLPLVLLTINPLGRSIRVAQSNLTEWMIMWWSRTMCRVFGIRVSVEGELPSGPVMLVANHMSWLDIEVLHSLRVFTFVAKAEIARWPLVGWMARAGGTVFHQRGDENSRHAVSDLFTAKLAQGRSVAIFAEGRTSDGTRVLPFHGRMFRPAVETGTPLVPAAIRYMHTDQLANADIAFGRTESFVANLFRVMGLPSIRAEVVFGQALATADRGRRELATQAREHVVGALEVTS